jgi:hypothetical protein
LGRLRRRLTPALRVLDGYLCDHAPCQGVGRLHYLLSAAIAKEGEDALKIGIVREGAQPCIHERVEGAAVFLLDSLGTMEGWH